MKLVYHPTRFHQKSVQENRFAFWGLTGEDATSLQASYRTLWPGELIREVTFSPPEEQPTW